MVHRGLSIDAIPDHDFICDFVNLDASHDYASCLCDLSGWSKFVMNCIFVHDYIDNQKSREMGFDVVRAVQDFCLRSSWRVTAVTDEEWPTAKLERK